MTIFPAAPSLLYLYDMQYLQHWVSLRSYVLYIHSSFSIKHPFLPDENVPAITYTLEKTANLYHNHQMNGVINIQGEIRITCSFLKIWAFRTSMLFPALFFANWSLTNPLSLTLSCIHTTRFYRSSCN